MLTSEPSNVVGIDTTRKVVFTVYGEAVPAGSKTTGSRKDGTRFVRDSGETRKKKMKTSEWRSHIQAGAGPAMNGGALLEGPLALGVWFHMPRPKGHYGTGRNAERLKASAPAYPTTRPDTTKLLRAVEDALTGIVYRDDAQIVDQHAHKRYAHGPARVEITVTTLAEKTT